MGLVHLHWILEVPLANGEVCLFMEVSSPPSICEQRGVKGVKGVDILSKVGGTSGATPL
jgi:hypothetical protein